MAVFDTLVPVGIVLVCLAGVAALAGLAYLMFTLTSTVKSVAKKADPLMDEAGRTLTVANETLARANDALEAVAPALDRADPLMERITLTVDAANLEIMRVDQILEDVNTITGNVSKATESLDTITSLPLDAISNVTGRLRDRIAPLRDKDCAHVAAAAGAVDQTLGCVEEKVDARTAAQEQANGMSSTLKDAFEAHVTTDAAQAC